MSALGLAVFADHVAHGGLYYDDWGLVSVVRFPPHSGALAALWRLYGRRPGGVAWYAALEGALGFHPHWQLALAAGLVVGEAVCLFALLRRLRMPVPAAAAIGALVLVFPFSDSQWLWPTLTANTFTIALYLLGIVAALHALGTPGWRGIAWHGVSLGLYLVGMFTYGESFALLGCLVGLLYVQAVGLRRARVRWGVDVGAVAASLVFTRTVLPKDVVTPYPRMSLHHLWVHAVDIANAAAHVLAEAAEPFGRPAAGLVLGGLAALLVWRARDRRWMVLAGAGLLVAVAAWAVYVPADYIYSPSSPGTGNRVNALAGIGVAVFLWAAAMLIVRRVELALVVTVAWGVGYVNHIAADARAWDRAASDQTQVLATIARQLPHPGAGATFFVADWPEWAAPGVPVFGEPYYLAGALRWAFSDRTLAGAQVDATSGFHCGTHHVVASRLPYSPPLVAAYGRAYLVDVRAGLVIGLRAPAQRTGSNAAANALKCGSIAQDVWSPITYRRRLARLTATLRRLGFSAAHTRAPSWSALPPRMRMTMSASRP